MVSAARSWIRSRFRSARSGEKKPGNGDGNVVAPCVARRAGQGITFEAGLGRALGWARIGISNERNQQLYLDLNPLGRPSICGSDARKASC